MTVVINHRGCDDCDLKKKKWILLEKIGMKEKEEKRPEGAQKGILHGLERSFSTPSTTPFFPNRNILCPILLLGCRKYVAKNTLACQVFSRYRRKMLPKYVSVLRDQVLRIRIGPSSRATRPIKNKISPPLPISPPFPFFHRCKGATRIFLNEIQGLGGNLPILFGLFHRKLLFLMGTFFLFFLRGVPIKNNEILL